MINRIISIGGDQLIIELVKDEKTNSITGYVVESKTRTKYRLEISSETDEFVKKERDVTETAKTEVDESLGDGENLKISLTLDRGQFANK